jgi:hypothetical protein
MAECIHDDELAAKAEEARKYGGDAVKSKKLLLDSINEKYTV